MSVPGLESQEVKAKGRRGQGSKFPRGKAHGPTWFLTLQNKMVRSLGASAGCTNAAGLSAGLLLSLLFFLGTAPDWEHFLPLSTSCP